MDLDIELASLYEAPLIAELAVALTGEIVERTGIDHFDVGLPEAVELCQRLMASGRYMAFIARVGADPVGFAGLSECHSLYAGGTFGTIQELFVMPAARSCGVGKKLMGSVLDFARHTRWTRLELCTPPLPEFRASLAFFERHGFEVTGGRKMRRLV